MQVAVTLLSRQGRFLPSADVKKAKACVGNLVVKERPVVSGGRKSTIASVHSATEATAVPLLPELIDANLLWAAEDEMRIAGVELIDGAMYGQTWSVKVL
jgi:hypothetical protein